MKKTLHILLPTLFFVSLLSCDKDEELAYTAAAQMMMLLD